MSSGNAAGSTSRNLLDVIGGRRVAVLERHLDHAVIDADGRTVGKGEIVGARRQPDIVDDQRALVLGNDLADLVLDRLEDPLGPIRSGFRPAREREAGSGRRRSAGRSRGRPAPASRRRGRASRRATTGTMNRRRSSVVSKPNSRRACARSRARRRRKSARTSPPVSPSSPAGVLALEQQADGDRRQGPRQSIGRQHGKHDGKSERREQVLGRAVEEHDRREHATDGKRRDQGRHRDSGGAVQRRLGKRLSSSVHSR